jgi:hypothetical protein
MTATTASPGTLFAAHLLRELTAVTETGTADDVIWARQAIDALLELKKAADAARDAGHNAIDAEILAKHCRWFREAADAGIVLNAGRCKLQRNGTRWRPGCMTALMTTCGSPTTCAFRSTVTKPNRS